MTVKTQLKTYEMQQKQFIAIQSYLKKPEKPWLDNLTLYLRQLEQVEQKDPKVSRRKEIIKIRAEITEKEMRNNSKGY